MVYITNYSEDALFPLKYLLGIANYEVKNSKEALKILYRLLGETETRLKQHSGPTLFDVFGSSSTKGQGKVE